MFPLLSLLCITMGLIKTAAAEEMFCQTVDSEDGRCIKLIECPSLYKLIQTQSLPLTQNSTNYLRQSVCGFAGKIPKVCCPYNGWDIMDGPSYALPRSLLNKHTCGLPVQHRRAGGTEAHINEFPWMALLVYDSGYLCAGTIITERYVLTAAYCITDDLRRVRIGELTIITNPDCETFLGKFYCAPPYQELDIEETIIHELYIIRTFANTIALIRVVGPIDFTVPNAMPICLPFNQNLQRENFDGKNLMVTGWGLEKLEGLRKAAVQVINNTECEALFKAARILGYITATKMCANTGGQDFCRGSAAAGGPLMYMGVYDNHMRSIQYGILSYGSTTYDNGIPDVYVRITKYVQWILDHIKP